MTDIDIRAQPTDENKGLFLTAKDVLSALKGTQKKERAQRSRYYMLILYPDNPHDMDILSYLKGEKHIKFPYQGCYILHEPEKDEKKEHYHVVLAYPNARTRKGVIDSFGKGDYLRLDDIAGDDGEPHKQYKGIIDITGYEEGEEVGQRCVRNILTNFTCSPITDIHSTAMYLIHKTYECLREGKKEYALSDVKALGNDFNFIPSLYEVVRDVSSGSQIYEIINYIKTSKVSTMKDLIITLYMNNESCLIKYVEKHSYLVKTLFDRG